MNKSYSAAEPVTPANPSEAASERRSAWGSRAWTIGLVVLAGAGVAVAAYRPWKGESGPDNTLATYTVSRDELVMSVKEGGNIESQEKLEIKSEVEGNTTIIGIVPEGTIVTGEDVEDGRVLVELDSSKLKDQLISQEEALESARINYTDALQSKNIQENQNRSNVNKALLKVKFARMDLEKYLGDKLAARLLDEYKEQIERADSDFMTKIDLCDYVESEDLGGEALQRSRVLTNEIRFADEEFSRADEDYNNTRKLADRNFVTRLALKEAELKRDRLEMKVQQARTDRDLFLKYEFPKTATERFSNYIETIQELERVRAQAESELSKAIVRLKGKERHLRIQEEKVADTKEQIENCTIEATKPGMVVYANQRRRPPIEEGATVRERQTIVIIPDSSSMALEVDVHESVVQQVQPGMPALIRIEALPDTVLKGRVDRVSILPDSGNWIRRQSGIKVYKTVVAIEETDTRLKPGMSGSVEIFTGRLTDALLVPVQAIHSAGPKHFVCLMNGGGYELRQIEIGSASDKFVQIVSGLDEGDVVRLDPPGDLGERLAPHMPDEKSMRGDVPDDVDLPRENRPSDRNGADKDDASTDDGDAGDDGKDGGNGGDDKRPTRREGAGRTRTRRQE